MINAINGKTIIRTMPKRDLPSLKGIIKLNSFAIGKNQLGPCITGLFQKKGYDITEIHLDNVAKIRLLGMSPALEQRVEKGETIDKIFSDLDLSSFLTENQNLYILGDLKNVTKFKKPTKGETKPETSKAVAYKVPDIPLSEAEKMEKALENPPPESTKTMRGKLGKRKVITARVLWVAVQNIKDRASLINKEFKVVPYTITITSPDPKKFMFEIKGVKVKETAIDELAPESLDAEYTLNAQITEKGIKLFFPDGEIIFKPDKNNVSRKGKNGGVFYKIKGLKLRQITEALLKVIRRTQE